MARNTIGSMVAVVSATADQFGRDIKQIEGHIDHLDKKANSSGVLGGGMMGAFAKGAAAGAGIGAVMAAIDGARDAVDKMFETLSSADDLADFATQIGATANEITALRFAAMQGGSSAEAMDAALQKMITRIGEARGGAKETADAFRALGLNVDDLANMSAGEALKTIADRFKTIKNPADQAALAMDIFGKQGVNLVNTLNLGREGIEALTAAGHEVGAVLANEDVAAAAKLNDEIEALTAAWNGLWSNLTAAVVPILEDVVGWMTEMVGVINRAVTALREFLGLTNNGLASPSPTVAGSSVLQDLEEMDKAAADAQKAMDDLMKKGEQVAMNVRTPFEVFNDTIAEMVELLNAGAISWQTYERAIAEAVKTLDKASEVPESADSFQTTPGVGAAVRGTSTGFSAVQAANRTAMDFQRRQLEIEQKHLAEAQRQTTLQKNIQAAFDKQPKIVRGVSI